VVDVTAEIQADGTIAVTLQDPKWELTVRAAAADFAKLRDIQHTTGKERSLGMGRCADAPVWWNEQDGLLHILVGHDDMTWDVGVTVPPTTAEDVVRAVEQELQRATDSPWPPRP